MTEYQDALDRARRLSVAREAALAGNESAMNVVTLDDLLIYTRSLICQLHSVKKIHAFLKVEKNKHPFLTLHRCALAFPYIVLRCINWVTLQVRDRGAIFGLGGPNAELPTGRETGWSSEFTGPQQQQ